MWTSEKRQKQPTLNSMNFCSEFSKAHVSSSLWVPLKSVFRACDTSQTGGSKPQSKADRFVCWFFVFLCCQNLPWWALLRHWNMSLPLFSVSTVRISNRRTDPEFYLYLKHSNALWSVRFRRFLYFKWLHFHGRSEFLITCKSEIYHNISLY